MSVTYESTILLVGKIFSSGKEGGSISGSGASGNEGDETHTAESLETALNSNKYVEVANLNNLLKDLTN